jgi:drug/metabolite transporter (DMT)-like permease
MLLGLTCALLAALMYGAAAIFQAMGTRSVDAVHALDLRLLFRLLRSPSFDTSLVLTLGGFVFHLIALRMLPLFLAQSGIAASLAVTAVLAVLVFHDHLNATAWWAVGGVCAGLALLSLSAGQAGNAPATRGLTVILIAALALMVFVGAISHWLHGALATGLLGLMAGIGYAVVGVSARILPGFSPGELVTSGATYVLVAAGVLAFLLYSVSLQRGSVTVATAPMITAQTLGPSIAGIAWLGDTIRENWWPVATLGFVLAGAAVAILVHSEGERSATAAPMAEFRG